VKSIRAQRSRASTYERLTGVATVTFAVAVAMSGCTGGTANPNPQPSIRCLVAQVLLVQAFPVSGAIGVPVATNTLAFAIPQGANASGYQVQLVANGQTRMGSVLGPPPSPLPSPIATLPPNYVYAGATPPTLQTATTYTVQLTQPITCLGPATTGTFSTQ
jgi:hypothetical protein